MVELKVFNSREEWLGSRRTIGGSDASAVIGYSHYMSSTDLWAIKTGRKKQADISMNPIVMYGTEAEEHLRALFCLDFPEYDLQYLPFNMVLNDRYPFAHASLDGFLTEKTTGRKGILEIKTASIMNGMQWSRWQDCIPDSYFIQILHYFLVTEYDFAVLKAQLKNWTDEGEMHVQTRHYRIERRDHLDDIRFLAEKEKEFWGYVERDERPPLVLPEI